MRLCWDGERSRPDSEGEAVRDIIFNQTNERVLESRMEDVEAASQRVVVVQFRMLSKGVGGSAEGKPLQERRGIRNKFQARSDGSSVVNNGRGFRGADGDEYNDGNNGDGQTVGRPGQLIKHLSFHDKPLPTQQRVRIARTLACAY